MLSKVELSAVVGAELEGAIALARAADDGNMATALAYYEGELPSNDDKADDPLREAVSLDVADMVEAVYAQMAPAIEDAGGIEFEAMGPEDEGQAKRETEIVRSILMDGYQAEGGFVAFSEAIKDCLLMRRGVMVLWIDRSETETPETWRNVSMVGVGRLMQPNKPRQRVEAVQVDEQEPGEADESGEAGEAEGGMQQLYTVKLTRVDVEQRLALACVQPENFVGSSLALRDPNADRFCADRMVTTRAKLVAEGFDEATVKRLPKHDPTRYELHLERQRGQAAAGAQPTGNATQVATETVEVWRCYVMLGKSMEAAKASRYRVYYSRDLHEAISEPESVGRVCYALGNTMLYPHRRAGVSLFDRIGEIQEIKSKGLRNWIENLHRVNRQRLVADETLVNMADLKDETADIVRARGPNAVMPIATADAGPSVLAFLQYQDQARTERGGASLEMQSATGQVAMNQTATGIERQFSVKEQLAATMARTFAETAVRAAYQIAHYLLRTSWEGPLRAKVGGHWDEVTPSQWPARAGVRVGVGQSRSERMAKAGVLQQLLSWQAAAMQGGKEGVLVDDRTMFNTVQDWIGATQLRNPERYLIDPNSPQGRSGAQRAAAARAAAVAAEAAARRAGAMLEKYKVDVKAMTDVQGQMADLAEAEAKLLLTPAPIDEAQATGGAAVQGFAGAAQQDVAAAQPAAGGGRGAPAALREAPAALAAGNGAATP